MKILKANPEGSIGVVSDIEGLQHLGTFKVSLLKEWLKQIDNVLGEPCEIHLFMKKSESNESYGLFASYDGDDPVIAVLGTYPEDGKKWGKQGAEKTKRDVETTSCIKGYESSN